MCKGRDARLKKMSLQSGVSSSGCRPDEPLRSDEELVAEPLGTLPSKSESQKSRQTEQLMWYCSETPGEKSMESVPTRTRMLRSKASFCKYGASAAGGGTASALEQHMLLSLHCPKGNQTNPTVSPIQPGY